MMSTGETLNSAEKKYLRGLAHHLKPLVQIGKNGLTVEVISQIDQCLLDHELFKIKFNDFQEEKKKLAAAIEGKTGCRLAGMIGNVAILFRQHPDEEKRKIFLPGQGKP